MLKKYQLIIKTHVPQALCSITPRWHRLPVVTIVLS